MPDASALLAVIFGLLDPGGEQARRVVHRTLDALEAYPFLYRYPPDGSDGFSGVEGAFVPVSFWAVTAQALTGDLRGALARMDDLCAVLPRLLAEEVDPVEGDRAGQRPPALVSRRAGPGPVRPRRRRTPGAVGRRRAVGLAAGPLRTAALGPFRARFCPRCRGVSAGRQCRSEGER